MHIALDHDLAHQGAVVDLGDRLVGFSISLVSLGEIVDTVHDRIEGRFLSER